MRLLRLRHGLSLIDKCIRQRLRLVLVIAHTLLMLGIITAGVFQYHEYHLNQRYTTFHDDIFLIIMNIVTIGSSDVSFLSLYQSNGLARST